MLVVSQYLGFNVCGDPTHGVVGGGEYGNKFCDRVNAEVGARELRDVGEL